MLPLSVSVFQIGATAPNIKKPSALLKTVPAAFAIQDVCLDDAHALAVDGLDLQLVVGQDHVAVAPCTQGAVIGINAQAAGGVLAGGTDGAFQRDAHVQYGPLHAVVQAGSTAGDHAGVLGQGGTGAR